MILCFNSADNGEEGKDKEDGSEKTDMGQTQDGTITARSRAESLADTTDGLEDAKSKHESEDGMFPLPVRFLHVYDYKQNFDEK